MQRGELAGSEEEGDFCHIQELDPGWQQGCLVSVVAVLRELEQRELDQRELEQEEL